MRDQRRLVITCWKKVGASILPTHGHLIGPGKRSVDTIHRKLHKHMAAQIKRAAMGRHVWWPNLFPTLASAGITPVAN